MTFADFHGYLQNYQRPYTGRKRLGLDIQDSAPVQAEDEDGKTTAVESETDPVKMKEEVLRKLLTVQHAESRRVCVKAFPSECCMSKKHSRCDLR
jgi:hypothetical protein